MINFFVSDNTIKKSNYSLPQVFLQPDAWNDWWKFQTLYSVVILDADGVRHHMGGIKIGQLDMGNDLRPDLPAHFTQLDQRFFALGQDVDYYENIKELGDETRENIHTALNDIAFDEAKYDLAIGETVTTNSLLRSVSQTSVTGQFRRLAQGVAELTVYHFEYTSFSGKTGIPPVQLSFSVHPKSNPPSNIHVLIGRNGVGKTRLINNMIASLMDSNALKYGKFSSSISVNPSGIFANLISVNFSAFDESEPYPEQRNKTLGISYSYIGLKGEAKKGERNFTPKSPIKLKNEFTRSAYLCKIGGKSRRLRNAIRSLETDPIFREADISRVIEIEDQKDFEAQAGEIFHRLSSGHKIVILTITRLVETLEERSLVLIDEPEAHLHPPLLSAFIRTLSDQLIDRNAVAVIATHSPVVLQEVPKSCCWKLRRIGANAIAERLEMESFGENVGSLTQEVFGLEVTDSGFHQLLKKSVEPGIDYNLIINKFDNQLGFEAKALLRALVINAKNI